MIPAHLLLWLWSSLCECNGKESEEVVVGGFDGDVGFDESLPLAHEGSQLVRGEVEAVEVGQAVLALHFVDTELDFSKGMVFVLLEVRERDFKNAAFESVIGVLETRRAVY